MKIIRFLPRVLRDAIIIGLVTIALSALIEAPFRLYDYWVRFPAIQGATSGNLGAGSFDDIISYLLKTRRVVRDPDLIWKHTPEAETYEFNSLGIRGSREYSLSAGPGVFRIIVLGGSQPFGLGVEADEAYSAQLEDALNRACETRDFQVINAAAPGHSTVQVLNFFRIYLLPYTPDLIIVDAGFNDRHRLSGDFPLQDKDLVAMSPMRIRLTSLAERSFFFWYVRSWLSRPNPRMDDSGPVAPQSPRTRVSPEDTLRNYREIQRIASANEIDTLFVSQFHLDMEAERLDLLPMSHQVEPFVDIYTRLSLSDDLLGDFIDPVHTSPRGHGKIASYLLEYFIDELGVCPAGGREVR